MTSRIGVLVAATLAPLLCMSCAAPPGGGSDRTRCSSDGRTYLQVLGSGGPMHAEGRGGSAYALWLSRRPVVVVDMGADTPAALARAGAPRGSVEVLLVTHLHADHVSGVADFLWGEMAAERQGTLVVAGPGTNSDSEQAKRWSLADLDGVLRSVQREYKGLVTVASDLVCLPL
jgi:ribonuclease BN (tRNA processing enzyme)